VRVCVRACVCAEAPTSGGRRAAPARSHVRASQAVAPAMSMESRAKKRLRPAKALCAHALRMKRGLGSRSTPLHRPALPRGSCAWGRGGASEALWVNLGGLSGRRPREGAAGTRGQQEQAPPHVRPCTWRRRWEHGRIRGANFMCRSSAHPYGVRGQPQQPQGGRRPPRHDQRGSNRFVCMPEEGPGAAVGDGTIGKMSALDLI
jgi:hypothetical protein